MALHFHVGTTDTAVAKNSVVDLGIHASRVIEHGLIAVIPDSNVVVGSHATDGDTEGSNSDEETSKHVVCL